MSRKHREESYIVKHVSTEKDLKGAVRTRHDDGLFG
jgi:hypothetical protein